MKPLLSLAAGCLCGLLSAGCAQSVAKTTTPIAKATTTKPPTGFSRTVVLWPEGAPGALGTSDGDVPKLFVYPVTETPATKAAQVSRSAVIVMPGGGYMHLTMEKEGAAEARWLNAHGIAAFVLEYRLGPRYRFPAPMLDGARAVRFVRSHAKELGVAKDRVGLWGFSAGAHLAGYLATVNDDGEPKAADPIERVSDRPDFAIMSYGRFSMDSDIPRKTNIEGLIGNHPSPELLDTVSIYKHVTKKTSPCFIFATTADQQVNSLNATAFYDALKRAGVPVELHIFERGPHGVGMAQGLARLPELAIYPTLLANWMQHHGWMTAGS
jgi:acetyl esterase/lipase